MKFRLTLFDMDAIKYEHLKANLQYFKWDTILEAQKFLTRLERSTLAHVVERADAKTKMIFDVLRAKGEFAVKDIDSVISFSVKKAPKRDDVVVMEVYISPMYFASGEAVKQKAGALKRFMKVWSPQDLINNWYQETIKLYSSTVTGEILESDDIPDLHVPTLNPGDLIQSPRKRAKRLIKKMRM